MKICWVGNAHLQPTGYGIICKNVVSYVQNNSKHEMVEVAISGLNRVIPFEWQGVKVYGNTGEGGQFGIGDWPGIQAIENPDVWLLNFDAWAAGPPITQVGVKYAIYPPIDHDPLAPPWIPILRNAVEIVPYCQFGARVIREGLGMTVPMVDYIPHGVDVEAFRPLNVSKTAVFGQETPQDAFTVGIFKNNQGTRAKYEVMLEGFRRFVDLVGDNTVRLYLHTNKVGKQAFNLDELVRRFGLAGHVYVIAPQRYQHGLPVNELVEMYNGCDVILNTVAGEGWGLPITEAFACGKPVIATAFSSMPELLSGVEGELRRVEHGPDIGECLEVERGWLVPTSGEEMTQGKRSTRRIFRSQDVAIALVKAYEAPEKRAAMGENAREWVQRFSWKIVGARWIDYFDALEEKVIPKKRTWKPCETAPVGQNKTACAVFSFNRPGYLVETLASLAGNTKADECDWYFYQDGWKNDERFPYLSEEDEIECHKRVQQCVEILNDFPFKHKEVVTKENNVCIGRQLQEAKARLFKKYARVIFFDDDHVVSRDYIDVLLKLHEQYPDAIVGAQATEARNVPCGATLDEVGITLKQMSDTNIREGRWRWLGYLLPASVHKATVREMDEYMNFIGPSYRDIPHHAVRTKYGVHITGFDGVMDKFCDQHGIQRIATVIPRGRYIGETGLFGSPQLFKRMGFPLHNRYEFDEAQVGKFRVYGAPVEKRVDAHGHSILPDGHGRLEGADPWVTGLIKARVKEGDTVLDLGAAVGYYTLLLSDLVGPEGKVYAFEPDPTNFAILEKNLAGRGNVKLANVAVSDEAGKAMLHLSKTNLGDHRLHPPHAEMDVVEVNTVRLDVFLARALQSVDFIKLDVQGAEGAAIRGMGKLLAANGNLEIVAEYAPQMMESSGVGPAKFLSLLAGHGFKLFGVRGQDKEFKINKPLEILDSEQLSKDYPVEDDRFTDLWFVKETAK